MRYNDERIIQLKLELQVEKKNLNQQLQVQVMQLQGRMDQLKIQHQNEISSNDTQIHQLYFSIEKLKDNPKIYEFRKEALELNTLFA